MGDPAAATPAAPAVSAGLASPLVLKFGGTSVQDADAMRRVVRIVRDEGGRSPVVIASACAGITNALVDCAQRCREMNEAEAMKIVDAVEARHRAILADICPPDSPHSCAGLIDELVDELRRVVRGVMLLGEVTPRTVDAILAFGERLSTPLLTAAFRQEGIDAALADSRRFIRTDGAHGSAKPDMEEIERLIAEELLPLCAQHEAVIAQGFIGSTAEGVTTTIGRGGSDFSAALVGGGIGSPEIQIWTDVDGVMTADPRFVPNARAVRQMTFTEARELAWFGAKVIHPDTILPAVAKKIPVVIRNSMASHEPGTTIYPDGFDVPPGIHSLTAKRALVLVELATSDPGEGKKIIDTAMGTFARYDAPIECAVIAEARASVVVSAPLWNDRLRAALESVCQVTVRKGIALLCLIGSGLRETPALLSGSLAALGDISLRLVAAGSSDHIILAALDESRADEAVIAVHEALFND